MLKASAHKDHYSRERPSKILSSKKIAPFHIIQLVGKIQYNKIFLYYSNSSYH